MSYNIFINSSILNFGANDREKITLILNSVNNPKWHTDFGDDENEMSLNIIIDEDFDRRHITALINGLDK